MKCPKCNATMNKVEVSIQGVHEKVNSLQCSGCSYFEFKECSSRVLEKLKQNKSVLIH